MGIVLTSNFDMNSALPLDSRIVAADTTARDAIASGRRYQGLFVYVIADAKTYQLQGGTSNSNWVDVSGSGSATAANALTAFAGGGQASATQLSAQINRVTTVATAGDSVKLPAATAGAQIVVINDGANSMNIFPASGESIDALAANAAYALIPLVKVIRFVCPVAGLWKSTPTNQAKDFTINGLLYGAQTTESSTTGAAASVTPTTLIHKFTSGSLTSLGNIVATATNQFLILINGTGNAVTIVNDSGGTAANRIKTGTGADLTWNNNTALFLAYDSNASRWQIIGGSGSTSPTVFGSTGSPRNIVAGTGITSGASHMSTTAIFQTIFLQGNAAGENDISVNPQITAGTIVGQRMVLVGMSTTQFVKLEDGNGLKLNGDWYSYNRCRIELEWDGTDWSENWRRDA